MVDGADVQRLQSELARAFFVALQREDWAVAHHARLQTAAGGFGVTGYRRADGSEDSVPLPRAARELWPRLRAAMTDDVSGAWLSAELEVTADGRFEFTFNWDRRPWMNTRTGLLDPPEHRTTGPSDEDWREDLRLHPRSPERTPDWLAAIVAAGPPPPAPDPEVDPARMRQRFETLLAQPGWSELADAVLRHTVELVRTSDWSWYDPEEPPEDDPEIEVLVQDVVSAVIRERLDPMPAGTLRGLYAGALAAGFVPQKLLGLPVDAAPAGAASGDIARRTVVELVARLTESLVVRR